MQSGFEFDSEPNYVARICVVGVGGGGGNAVANMIREGLSNVDFVVINTDRQALDSSPAENKIQAGRQTTRGLGAGARPLVGREAVRECLDEVETALHDYDMVFITAGMGGGTGTGGAPVVAEVARRKGILAVAIVTLPFEVESAKRLKMAMEGIDELKLHVDTLIAIPNDKVLDISDEDTTLMDAFMRVDQELLKATRGISELITIPGLINLDFADVRTTIEEGGTALMGAGTAAGEDRASKAATEAITSPLMDGMSINGARHVLVNITAAKGLKMHETKRAVEIIRSEAGPDSEVIFGAVIDESMGEDDICVIVVATGMQQAGVSEEERTSEPPQRLIKRRVDYKGEESLRILDRPAYERRGFGQPARPASATQTEGKPPPEEPEDHSRKPTREGPAFLRKMMD